MHTIPRTLGLTLALLTAQACTTVPGRSAGVNPVVGVWLVHDMNAPFPYHLYVFNADGTVQQANPDAGDPKSSDSDGKGVWVSAGGRIRGKWMEVLADRTTHRFIGRTEITFDIGVDRDTLSGTETVRSYDADGALTAGPTPPGAFSGTRVTYR